MSVAFWKPGRIGAAAQWWARCDHCRWSGPAERFTFYRRGAAFVSICDHYWCAEDSELVSLLAKEGWEKVS